MLLPTEFELPKFFPSKEINVGMSISGKNHHNLTQHITYLMQRAEVARRERASYFFRVEKDLYAESEPTGSDCARDKQRQEGEGTAVPDSIFPVGMRKLHDFAAEVTSIVFPIEAPYRVAVANGSGQAKAEGITKALRFQAQQFHHRSNVTAAIRDGVSLNFAGLEMNWTEKSYSFGDISRKEKVGGAEIKHLDPYNIGYDPSLNLVEAVQEGSIVYHIDMVSGENLLRQRSAGKVFFRDEHLQHTSSFSPVLEDNMCIGRSYRYFMPKIREHLFKLDGNKGATDFGQIFGGVGQWNVTGSIHPRYHHHEVTTVYIRLVPFDWGLGPGKEYQLWKIKLLNSGFIIRAQEIGDGDAVVPMSLGSFDFDQPLDRGTSMGESVANMNMYISTMLNLHKRALRNHVSGGWLFYDPAVFDLNDPNKQHGRIPSKQQMHNDRDISRFVRQVSSQTDTRDTLGQVDKMTAIMDSYVPQGARTDLAGLDRATSYHAMAVAATAPVAVLHSATIIDDQLVAPCRHGVRQLNMEYGEELTYLDDKTQEILKLTKQEMAETQFMMTASAALTGIDKMRISILMRDAINLTAQMGDQIPAASLPLLKQWLTLEGSGFDFDSYMEEVNALAQQAQERQIQLQQAANAQPPEGGPQ